MKDFIKEFMEKLKTQRGVNKYNSLKAQVNDDVVVVNDPNDNKSGMYVVCNGVPVMKVGNETVASINQIGIDDLPEFIANIKAMYMNKLYDIRSWQATK